MVSFAQSIQWVIILILGASYYSEVESFSSYADIFDLAAESLKENTSTGSKYHHKIIGQ